MSLSQLLSFSLSLNQTLTNVPLRKSYSLQFKSGAITKVHNNVTTTTNVTNNDRRGNSFPVGLYITLIRIQSLIHSHLSQRRLQLYPLQLHYPVYKQSFSSVLISFFFFLYQTHTLTQNRRYFIDFSSVYAYDKDWVSIQIYRRKKNNVFYAKICVHIHIFLG